MEKKYKFDWKIVFGIIILILVVLLARSLLLSSDENGVYKKFKNSENIGVSDESMWESLDKYEDKIMECSLQIGTYLNNLDSESASSKIPTCQSELNNALLQIYKWDRDNPSKETKAMKIDYEGSSYFFSA